MMTKVNRRWIGSIVAALEKTADVGLLHQHLAIDMTETNEILLARNTILAILAD
jgi:hypothetical protein